MQTLIVVSKSTPFELFHFIISNHVRFMEDQVQRIATIKIFAFMLFQEPKVPLWRQLHVSSGGNSPGENCPRGAIVLGENCTWGELSDG